MDRYTKSLLTIIAASFAVIAWWTFDPAPVHVALVDCNYGISDFDRRLSVCPRVPGDDQRCNRDRPCGVWVRDNRIGPYRNTTSVCLHPIIACTNANDPWESNIQFPRLAYGPKRPRAPASKTDPRIAGAPDGMQSSFSEVFLNHRHVVRPPAYCPRPSDLEHEIAAHRLRRVVLEPALGRLPPLHASLWIDPAVARLGGTNEFRRVCTMIPRRCSRTPGTRGLVSGPGRPKPAGSFAQIVGVQVLDGRGLRFQVFRIEVFEERVPIEKRPRFEPVRKVVQHVRYPIDFAPRVECHLPQGE